MEKFHFHFYDWEKKAANEPFLRQPFGDNWEITTWAEAGQTARKLAAGLQSLGLPPKTHIGLVSKNCREWIIADIAIIMAGYISVPLYPTLDGKQINEVIRLGDVEALIVGKIEDNWTDMQKGIPDGMPIITMPHYEGAAKIQVGHQWHEFINKFEPIAKVDEPNMDDTWTIIFTSGTTGTPKGVVLTYRVLDSTSLPTEKDNPLKLGRDGTDRFFSYLPLNHIAERVVVEMTCMRYGGTISFAESLATFAKNLGETQPNVFFAVPRIWTKFQLGILKKMPKINTLLKIPILSGIIKKKIKAGLGLSNARACVSGAAMLPETLKNWYKSVGIDIMIGYGMTENCAIATNLMPGDNKPGSVGKAQVGAEIRIEEGTNEILMKGPYVMTGYYKDPEKTAETIKDGWLHTGDQGRMDKDGFLCSNFSCKICTLF